MGLVYWPSLYELLKKNAIKENMNEIIQCTTEMPIGHKTSQMKNKLRRKAALLKLRIEMYWACIVMLVS